MTQQYTLYFPVANTVEEAETAYDRALRAFVVDMGSTIDGQAKAAWGENWFAELMSTGHKPEHQQQWKSIYNPSSLFGEPLHYPDSPIWQFLPNTYSFREALIKARHVRNSWAHQFGAFGMDHLYIDLQRFKAVANALNLQTANPLQGLISRIQKILNGEFEQQQPEPVLETAITVDAPTEAARELDLAEAERKEATDKNRALEEQQPRPRIGSRWVGPKPARALRVIPKLNEIVDRQTNQSIRAELGDDAEVTIARWLMPKPLGDLFVDTDGAVLGYIQGEPYLFGYLGRAPKRNIEEIEGFVLNTSYSLVGGDIRDETTGQLLTEAVDADTSQLRAVIAAAVDPLDELKITTHGDLFSYSEHGPVKIARVPAALWFEKSLPNEF